MKCCRQAINKEKITINFRLEYKKCKEKLCANNTVVSIQNHIDFFYFGRFDKIYVPSIRST